MARIGYARVSTEDQSLALQRDALAAAGYDTLFEDKGISGIAVDRPGLSNALTTLQPGDTFLVWRIDRIARSMRELTDIVYALHNRGITFRSLCEHIDVGTAVGEFTLHILSAAAHLERSLIVERTRAGMAAAKARGVKFGRRAAISPRDLEEAMFLIRRGMRVKDVAAQLGVGRSTLYRYFAAVRAMNNNEEDDCVVA